MRTRSYLYEVRGTGSIDLPFESVAVLREWHTNECSWFWFIGIKDERN